MADAAPQAKKSSGWIKAGILGVVGLGSGIAGTYATAVVNSVVKPAKPVANFSVSAEGLTVTCQNRATGDSGWWDFGDGTALEPFATDSPVTHTYVKPGNYSVKLTVRNFLADENERSVPVEVKVGPKDAPAPLITNFAVRPVGSSSMAPATFRVTGDVANADHCVWDYGDGRLEVVQAGKIDRMVTFDKPGAFPLSVVAHSSTQAVKQASAVKVEAAPVGTLMAVLKVTDSGSKITRLARNESVAIPVPSGKNAPANFSKTIQARPGCTIVDAAPAAPNIMGVKNLKAAVSADRRSVTVSGDWAGDQKAAAKVGGGSDVVIPLKMTEDRAAAVQPAVTHVTGAIPGQTGRCDLPLPPLAAGMTREFQIEIRQVLATGPVQVVARGPLDGKGSVKLPWSYPSGAYTFSAVGDSNHVVVGASLTGR
jgi:hypothetical protein